MHQKPIDRIMSLLEERRNAVPYLRLGLVLPDAMRNQNMFYRKPRPHAVDRPSAEAAFALRISTIKHIRPPTEYKHPVILLGPRPRPLNHYCRTLPRLKDNCAYAPLFFLSFSWWLAAWRWSQHEIFSLYIIWRLIRYQVEYILLIICEFL